ncbi:kinase-like domain-containing protein [Suillus plorans]|uniref:non-specific serine/threonine protein kinase n=1 Tax=Suillus plorans TaxID=116603 RepID=A0A9P7DKU0_9AGAM|nr:kinase-like domain-containing protein [Suillus plorans]KAG1797306.1 kinase-like domain-containing protein [Suillus plorans]
MNKVPTRVDGRFRLEDILGSGSYAVVYHAQNFFNDDLVAIKLEPLTSHPSSVERKYHILKRLEDGVGIPCAIWFGRESTYHALALELLGPSLHDLFKAHDRKFNLHTVVNLGEQLLSRLEHIHSYNYIHGDIKPQNVLLGLGDLSQTLFVVNFGIAKKYWNAATETHIPFRQGRRLTGTPAFASINNHLGLEPGCRDDLESLSYMLIYFMRGTLPWLTSSHEKLSSSDILERKVDTTITVLCDGVPSEFANLLVYSRSLSFSEDPDYDYLRSLLHGLRTTETCFLDFIQPNDPVIHSPTSNIHLVAEAASLCLPKATPVCKSTRV